MERQGKEKTPLKYAVDDLFSRVCVIKSAAEPTSSRLGQVKIKERVN